MLLHYDTLTYQIVTIMLNQLDMNITCMICYKIVWSACHCQLTIVSIWLAYTIHMIWHRWLNTLYALY
jgi:hypothetical protein